MLAKQTKVLQLASQIKSRASIQSPDVILSADHTMHFPKIIIEGAPLTYKPSVTGSLFHDSDERFKLIMGPYGSGKSTICIADLVYKTITMPKCVDGIRRARWALVRNTYPDLERSTVKTWLDWFGNLGNANFTKKPLHYESVFYDAHGEVQLEIIFLALDREDDIPKKLKSFECTGFYLNELSELVSMVMRHVSGRTGRYPSVRLCREPFWHGTIADTNAPKVGSYLYDMFETGDPPEAAVLFKQPPGLIKGEDGKWIENPLRDNREFLPALYYTDMTKRLTEEETKVFCLGEYGSLSFGKKIYPQYNDDFHAVDEIKYDDRLDILCGMDFGNTPALVLAQVSPSGQIFVFKEFTSIQSNAEELITNIVLPWLRINCPRYVVAVTAEDPSGIANSQSNGISCHTILNKLGMKPRPASSNDPLVRHNAVKSCLNKSIMGHAALVISKSGCPTLREGFNGGYGYHGIRTLNGLVYTDKAEKNEYSHIHDALQYLCLLVNAAPEKKSGPTVIYYD